MASITTLYALGGSGSLDATEMRRARRIMRGAAAPAASADGLLAATSPRRVPAGSMSVLLYARPLPSPDASVRSAAAFSAYALFQQNQTIPEYRPRIDVYA